MTKFAYVALDTDGQQTSGTERAKTKSAAQYALYQRALRDVEVTETRSILQFEIMQPKVKKMEVMHLSRMLAAFVRAGLPLLDAVHTIGEESDNSKLREIMDEIEEGLRGGDGLSDCLDRHPEVFPDFYRGILRSSELTGQLDTVLDQLAAYLERDLAARRKITSAMIYPSVIIVMSIIAVIVLSTFVLPRFKVFFDGLHAELPLPTRMLLGFTAFIGTWWWLIVAVLAVMGVAIAFGLRTARGQYLRDATYLKIPVINGTVRDALVERFCRILASMTSAGVALPEALRVATGALHNGVYEKALSRVEEQMLEGEGIAKPIGETLLLSLIHI